MSFDCPIFITCRDRVTDLRNLVAWLEAAGHEQITLIDNDSRWPPLLDYLDASPHRVIRTGRNLGKRALWTLRVAPRDGFYVHSDPDVVPHEQCPTDLLERLHGLLERHPQYNCAGPGLFLGDVPQDMPSLDWESGPRIRGALVELAARASLIDTTFALYRAVVNQPTPCHAIRTEWPYMARHGSWYVTEPGDEDRFYLSRANPGPNGSSWAAQCAS